MSYRVPTLIVAAALLAGGCGSSAGNHTASSSGSTTAPPKAPYGVYARTVTRQDIARTARRRSEYGPSQSTPPTGRYRLVIARGAAQDVIKVTDPKGFMIDMDTNVAQGALTLTSYVDPNRASFCGPEIAVLASYTFRAAASSLQLQPQKKDPCADRDSMLTGTWSKG
jgi:hypothetical protein